MSLHASSPGRAFADFGRQWSAMEEGSLFFFVFLDFHGIKVFCLENLTAIQTLQVVHAVSSSNDLGAGMLTRGLHNATLR